MKKLFVFMLVLLPLLALAQGPFDGTWKADPTSMQTTGKPAHFVVENGYYQCSTCFSTEKIKADGQDQAVKGNPYCDTMAIKVVDDRTIESTCKKGGKVMSSVTRKVSEDGKTMTEEFKSSSEVNDQTGTGRSTAKRTSAAPAKGAHMISGEWMPDKMKTGSDNLMTATIETTADGLTMSTPMGFSYTAKFDGKDYPAKGDSGIDAVSLKKVDDKTIEETDKLKGKTLYVTTMTLQPGGQTMVLESTDKVHGQTSKFTLKKQ